MSNDFQSHADKCSKVLEKCPNNCFAYIERHSLTNHLNECPKALNQRSDKCDDNFGNLFTLERDVIALRSALQEEIRQRHRLITDVGEVRKKCQNVEILMQDFGNDLNELKVYSAESQLQQSTEKRNFDYEIDRLDYQYKVNDNGNYSI